MAQLTTKGRLETKPEQLRDPQVGIVGGCLSTGSRNVGLDSVYHRIVRREIREMTGLEIRFRLARQDVANTQAIRSVVADLIDGKKVDCVVFPIRPYLNLGLRTLFWRKLGTRGIRGLALNPYRFPGAIGSPGSGSLFPVVRWAKLNLALGNLFGVPVARQGHHGPAPPPEEHLHRCSCAAHRLGPAHGAGLSGAVPPGDLPAMPAMPADRRETGLGLSRLLGRV